MKKIKIALITFLAIIGSMFFTTASQADGKINIFTEHQLIHMVEHGVNANQDVRFPTGDLPYIGKLGFEYQFSHVAYSIAYIHRSNADLIDQDEYNYDGIAVGIKFSRCFLLCN